MQLKEICKQTGLTKKAIEYYSEQGLISPKTLANGYRVFAPQDAVRLREIAVLRGLRLSVGEIKEVLEDDTGDALRRIAVAARLRMERENTRQTLLDALGSGQSLEETAAALKALERQESVLNRLLEVFPGYYGRFVCLHFAPFLKEPVATEEQEKAYEEIIAFLDGLPRLELPEDLRRFVLECTAQISAGQIAEINDRSQRSLEEPERFLEENREMLDWYLAFKRSEEYRSSPAYRLQNLFREFNRSSGYNDVFLPAMRRLSPSYNRYCEQLLAANEIFLSHYPEAKEIEM